MCVCVLYVHGIYMWACKYMSLCARMEMLQEDIGCTLLPWDRVPHWHFWLGWLIQQAPRIHLFYLPKAETVHSHVQPCTAMYSHAQPCTSVHNHVHLCTAMYNHAQPCIVMYICAQSCTVMYIHAQPCTAFNVGVGIWIQGFILAQQGFLSTSPLPSLLYDAYAIASFQILFSF